ncbi:hypothetical protein QJS66_01545 [Kocuria rhizophila]|nr:hypothetical protein QJS66_01545 [Kocuria rhizophila]
MEVDWKIIPWASSTRTTRTTTTTATTVPCGSCAWSRRRPRSSTDQAPEEALRRHGHAPPPPRDGQPGADHHHRVLAEVGLPAGARARQDSRTMRRCPARFSRTRPGPSRARTSARRDRRQRRRLRPRVHPRAQGRRGREGLGRCAGAGLLPGFCGSSAAAEGPDFS